MNANIINGKDTSLNKELLNSTFTSSLYFKMGYIHATLRFDPNDNGFVEQSFIKEACTNTQSDPTRYVVSGADYYLCFLRRSDVSNVNSDYRTILTYLDKNIVYFDRNRCIKGDSLMRQYLASYFDQYPHIFNVIKKILLDGDCYMCVSSIMIVFYCPRAKVGIVLSVVPPADEGTDHYDRRAGMEMLYMITRTVLAGERKGIMLHGASNLKSNDANLFMGRGGGGKSTIINSLKGYHVLSDDVSIVLNPVDKGDFMLAPSLWNNDDVVARKGRAHEVCIDNVLRHVFFLKKATKLAMIPLSRSDAMRRFLYDDSPFRFQGISTDKKSIAFYFDFLRTLTRRCACYELEFPITEDLSDAFEKIKGNLR